MYHQEEDQTISILSVSRDPGQPIVFLGYIAMMCGMLVVLGTRVADYRRASGGASSGHKSTTERGRVVKPLPAGLGDRLGADDDAGDAGRPQTPPYQPPLAERRKDDLP